MANKRVPIVTTKGRVDRGVEMPKTGYNWLTNNPTNITKAMLKPTEYSMKLSLSLELNFKTSRVRAPGMNER